MAAIGSIFDHELIGARYFFPRAERAPSELTTNVISASGETLRCVSSVFDEDALTVLHFHGNGEVCADYVPEWVELMHGLGVNVFLAEYRGYGGSEGEPCLSAMLDDVELLAQATGVAPERLIVFGRSVGSIYALELASRSPQIAGLIIESGIANVLERVLLRVSPQELGVTSAALEQEAARRFDHGAKLGTYQGPLLLLHARWDHLVDVEHARQNARWSKSAEKLLVELPHGDHNSIFGTNRAEYIRQLDTMFKRVRALAKEG